MASQNDVQELLRLLTTGRNKLSMMVAMGQMKKLQSANLRSIAAIASADATAVVAAVGDEKLAKHLQASAKSTVKSGGAVKRPSADRASASSKRHRSAYELDAGPPQTPAELEASLALPAPSRDEEEMSRTVVHTNRAPLVLAFAASLLAHTMPGQPPSSRLSLAQAVVSANSRSRAVSLGITARSEGRQVEAWGEGQPKVSIMGREVSVLKRGGYEWRGDASAEAPSSSSSSSSEVKGAAGDAASEEAAKAELESRVPLAAPSETRVPSFPDQWRVSQPVTSKKSTFVARCIAAASAAHARSLARQLLATNADVRSASHNITAWRARAHAGGAVIHEGSDDDGESGGGQHVLRVLRSAGLADVLVVCSRWYGGVMLGPDRWRIMTRVVDDALAQRLRVAGNVVIDGGGGGGGGEALWGLDLEAMRAANSPVAGGVNAGMPICRPEAARAYILKAFASPSAVAAEGATVKKKSGAVVEREKERNLSLLLGALDLLFGSWKEHISRDELDRRAWGWYVQVRPDVEGGVAGWGGKGDVKLSQILDLRRKG